MYNKNLKISESEYNNILNAFNNEKELLIKGLNKLELMNYKGDSYIRIGFDLLRYTLGGNYITSVLYDKEGLNDTHIRNTVKRIIKYILNQ